MKKFYLAICAVTLISLLACNKHNDNNNLNAVDQAFITQTSISNKAEIAAGELALSKSTNPTVRSFSQMMITGYTEAEEDLETLAANLNFNLQDANVMQQQSIVSRLSGLSGYSFDTAYMHAEVKAHFNSLSVYQLTFNEGNNSTVKGYVHRFVDLIQMNYLKADSVSRSL